MRLLLNYKTMQTAPIPENESERLKAVASLNILDTPAEERFDTLTKEAVERLKVPMSAVSIVDSDREWYKSHVGMPVSQGPRESSFCGHVIASDLVFVVRDTLEDQRFKDNPQVVNPPNVRFYAGVTLHDRKTHLPIGTFCVKDIKPRDFRSDELQTLIELADRAEIELNQDGT